MKGIKDRIKKAILFRVLILCSICLIFFGIIVGIIYLIIYTYSLVVVSTVKLDTNYLKNTKEKYNKNEVITKKEFYIDGLYPIDETAKRRLEIISIIKFTIEDLKKDINYKYILGIAQTESSFCTSMPVLRSGYSSYFDDIVVTDYDDPYYISNYNPEIGGVGKALGPMQIYYFPSYLRDLLNRNDSGGYEVSKRNVKPLSIVDSLPNNKNIRRPNPFYLPDALYGATRSIIEKMYSSKVNKDIEKLKEDPNIKNLLSNKEYENQLRFIYAAYLYHGDTKVEYIRENLIKMYAYILAVFEPYLNGKGLMGFSDFVKGSKGGLDIELVRGLVAGRCINDRSKQTRYTGELPVKELNINGLKINKPLLYYVKEKFGIDYLGPIVNYSQNNYKGVHTMFSVIYGFQSLIYADYYGSQWEQYIIANSKRKGLNFVESGRLPYEVGSRKFEDLLKAAISVVGRVRYVWGGGHNYLIIGINPLWERFSQIYKDKRVIGKYITINSKWFWCPIHVNNCSETKFRAGQHGGNSIKLSDFLYIRQNQLRVRGIDPSYYSGIDFSGVKGMPEKIVSGSMREHSLEGLDCSGFVSWLYHQVIPEFKEALTAERFDNSSLFNRVDDFRTSGILPGDIIGWGGSGASAHVVVAILVNNKDKYAIVVNSSRPEVKFGVVFWGKYPNEAIKISDELNERLGCDVINTQNGLYRLVWNLNQEIFASSVYVARLKSSYGFIDKGFISEYMNNQEKGLNRIIEEVR